MPKLDGTGPEGKDHKSGRNLGKCSTATDEEKLQKLGTGMGEKRKSGGGIGQRKRSQSGLDVIEHKNQ
ncbi:MAG: DUF5320 family protein [Prolixibacteraceae bacterium]|jgi:hypothetical protein